MNTYSATEVLTYFRDKIGVQLSRKREYLDKRNYILALLYYEFKYVEEELGIVFNIDRSTVNYAKDLPFKLMKNKDSQFIEYTEEISKKFPYIFPENYRTNVPERVYTIQVRLNKEERDNLKLYAAGKEKRINNAARDIIKNYLKTLVKN